jgi:hypothetical protein
LKRVAQEIAMNSPDKIEAVQKVDEYGLREKAAWKNAVIQKVEWRTASIRFDGPSRCREGRHGVASLALLLEFCSTALIAPPCHIQSVTVPCRMA